jgi:hypothetical protein
MGLTNRPLLGWRNQEAALNREEGRGIGFVIGRYYQTPFREFSGWAGVDLALSSSKAKASIYLTYSGTIRTGRFAPGVSLRSRLIGGF